MMNTLVSRVLAGVGLTAVCAPQRPSDPAAVVTLLHESLVTAARKAADTDRTSLRANLRPIVERTHARHLGASGSAAEDTRRLRAAILDLLAARYAARIADTPELSFTPASIESLEGDDAAVTSGRIETGGKTTPLRYSLHREDGEWRISACLEKGVDPLADIRSTLSNRGIDAAVRRAQQRSAVCGASPSEVIRHLQRELLATMKRARELGYRGRFDRLAPVILETHDVPFIARYTIRKTWKGLSKADRERFLSSFEELSIATYVARFDGYSGERFEVLDEQKARRGYRTVRTRITKSDGDRVSLIYQMHRVDCRWSIVNVLADGVSDLATKRSEYRSIIKREGFAALVDKLRDHIRRFREENDK